MISQTSEYALRSVVCLGNHPQGPLTTQEISDATVIPASYLSKVLAALVRAELLRSQRGPRGGFELNRSPDRLSVLEVIEAVEPWKRYDRCPLGRPGHANHLCPLHRRLAHAQSLIEDAFRRSMLAELLETDGRPPACTFPAPES